MCLDAYDRIVGLRLSDLCVDGYLVKARCGAEAAGRYPVDRGKQGTERSVLVEAAGILVGGEIAGANRHDSALLRPSLRTLSRFGFELPEPLCVHLDAGYYSARTRELLTEPGSQGQIAPKEIPAPVQNTARWVVERTHSWHNRGPKKLAICTERRVRVVEAFLTLAKAIIIVRRLIRQA